MKNFSIIVVGVILLTLASSCTQVALLQDMNQTDANEVMVLMAEEGIKVKKEVVEKQQETTWKIFVAPDDEVRARQLLVAHQLPRIKELGLEGICKESGMIPTPKTEKCRELLAIKGEIINSIESIPGVVNAEVVINIPDKEDFPDKDIPVDRPAASIVVQLSENALVQEALSESNIQRFVANAVTGMDLRDVAVIISRPERQGLTEPRPSTGSQTGSAATNGSPGTPVLEQGDIMENEWVSIAGLTLTPRSAKKFKIMAIFFLVFFVLLATSLIVVLLSLSRMRHRETVREAMAPHPALPDKLEMDRLVKETKQNEAGRGAARVKG